MSLAAQFKDYFDPEVRRRGAQYWHDGLVEFHGADRLSVFAQVHGSSLYRIDLQHRPDQLSLIASCNCPHGQEWDGGCKHIYAVLLGCDQHGMLREVGTDAELILVEPTDSGDPITDEGLDELTEPAEQETVYIDVGGGRRQALTVKRPPRRPPRKAWRQRVESIAQSMRLAEPYSSQSWPADRQIIYAVDLERSLEGNGLVVRILVREPKRNGQWRKPGERRIPLSAIELVSDPIDRQVLSMLAGANNGEFDFYGYREISPMVRIPAPMQRAVLKLMCQTGRCGLMDDDTQELSPLTWDDGPPWEFQIEVGPDQDRGGWIVEGRLSRGTERLDPDSVDFLTPGGVVLGAGKAAEAEVGRTMDWMRNLAQEGPLWVPRDEGPDFIDSLGLLPALPPVDLPPELSFERIRSAPRPCLKVRQPKPDESYANGKLIGELAFDYEGHTVAPSEPRQGLMLPDPRRYIERDRSAEAAAGISLRESGFRDPPMGYWFPNELRGTIFVIPDNKLSKAVQSLVVRGWLVEAQGKLYRTGGSMSFSVRSGVDWFELHGSVDFDGQTASVPELLKALRKGESAVRLGDGTFGMLPEEWLQRYAPLAAAGEVEDDHIRFRPTQAMLLDALLAAQERTTCDEAFEKLRQRLRSFEGISPVDPPSSFQGQLRPYQRAGLGWFGFLRTFGFGGCLADDMGLGKTVQVLALIEDRRRLRGSGEPLPPSLVVAPRSLIHNWSSEAQRFAPALRVLDHSHVDRAQTSESFADYNLVLTTYGTLRRDAHLFAGFAFDYAILDEAQAIKNAQTASAKAARLLRASHRLALSGTPIENHLGELWSLMEFLNPGALGTVSAFGSLASSNGQGEGARELLSKALRPFILRRTKSQVASDLPSKTEQTIYCELSGRQRKLYGELRDHYRASLLHRVNRDGLNRSKMHVLEALLRLRQAACHPGMIDRARSEEDSAKLDALLPQLAEVTEEGHKALVFSQFTSFLDLLRKRLDEQQMRYEYLDGKTRERQARVQRFQNDPDCRVFLISLKAGGLGLNLTAAEYVFLLDPWWNPAVEAQAIDRAHRIGQANKVFAYRLIAKDTVEEKVLELQNSKRELAEAIITADQGMLRSLKREDLEILLS